MIVLDTDHISFLQCPDSAEGQELVRRLETASDHDIVTTVGTVEEQMRGWLQVIARYRDLQQQVDYYDKLIDFIRFFGPWNILPLHATAVRIFHDLQQARVRIATTDLKIAAICLANQGILLSRNARLSAGTRSANRGLDERRDLVRWREGDRARSSDSWAFGPFPPTTRTNGPKPAVFSRPDHPRAAFSLPTAEDSVLLKEWRFGRPGSPCIHDWHRR
ncbi:MAG: type II toxin-antitoxin system VapC family toxin [Pirellulales bacterium]